MNKHRKRPWRGCTGKNNVNIQYSETLLKDSAAPNNSRKHHDGTDFLKEPSETALSRKGYSKGLLNVTKEN